MKQDDFPIPAEDAPESYPEGEPGVLDIGHRHFVFKAQEDGSSWLWWHDCPKVRSWGYFGAPWHESANGQAKASGHQIASINPLTVGGSLLCGNCGDHGFITDGKWVPV